MGSGEAELHALIDPWRRAGQPSLSNRLLPREANQLRRDAAELIEFFVPAVVVFAILSLAVIVTFVGALSDGFPTVIAFERPVPGFLWPALGLWAIAALLTFWVLPAAIRSEYSRVYRETYVRLLNSSLPLLIAQQRERHGLVSSLLNAALSFDKLAEQSADGSQSEIEQLFREWELRYSLPKSVQMSARYAALHDYFFEPQQAAHDFLAAQDSVCP